MKRIYEEYLYVPEDGKIKEKVFIMRVAVAIVCMVCCLSAMGFSAYAFFTSSITSGSNTIVAATYGAEITVARDDNNPQTKVTPTVNQTIHTYSLVKGTYHVVIKATGNAQNGYCKIVIGDVNSEISMKYYTIQLNTDSKAEKNQIEFKIKCDSDNAQVHIIPNWGSCSETDSAKIIEQNEEITIENPTSETTEDASDNQLQKIPVTIPTTTPNMTSDSETSNTDKNTTTDSKEETQGSTLTSGEDTGNSDSLQDSETSQDGEVSEGKSSDNVTDNSSADHGNSEDTIPSEKVIE